MNGYYPKQFLPDSEKTQEWCEQNLRAIAKNLEITNETIVNEKNKDINNYMLYNGHVNMKDYINSKFKIFENQNKRQFALVNTNLKNFFKKKKLSGKLKVPNLKKYITLKNEFKNNYLKLNMNDENMSFVYELTKLLKIRKKSFLNSLNTFVGLQHRYEIFMKRNNCTFINDSKDTSFQSTKFALKNSKNIFWILGGMPKKNDKIILRGLKKIFLDLTLLEKI